MTAPEPKANPFDGDMGNWRDAPRAEAPKMEEPAKEMEEGKSAKEAGANVGPASAANPGGPVNNSRGGGGRGMGGRGGRGGRGGAGRVGATAGEGNALPKNACSVYTDKWAGLRR